MKKRMIAGMMGMALVAGSALMVSAAEIPPTTPTPAEQTMKVGYTEQSTFTISILASVTLKENEEVPVELGLTEINVGTKEKVQIKVKSGILNGKVTVKDVKDSTNTATSQVSLSSGGVAIADDEVVAEFDENSVADDGTITANEGGTLYFAALGDVKAGSYTGQITFEASIVDKN